MTYKEIFGRAFSDIYTRFPLSDTETICRNVKDRAAGKYIPGSKKKSAAVPIAAVLSGAAALSLAVGLLLGSGVFLGQDITTPGYAQMQAEMEAVRALDTHNITDEQRSDTDSVPLGISRTFGDYKVSLLWYKFDGTDAIIKYKVTCLGDIPDDLSLLPRPTSNYINPEDGFDSLPSFESYDIVGRDSNTFTLYSKLNVVMPPVYELPVGIDNRRTDGISSPYMFTALATIPEDRTPIEYDTGITLNYPGKDQSLILTHITINPGRISFTFDENDIVSVFGEGSSLTDLIMSTTVMMKNGESLVFGGGFGSGGNMFSCLLDEEVLIDPREVDYIEILGVKVYIAAEQEIIEIPPDEQDETEYAADDILIYSHIYGGLRLEEVRLHRKDFSVSVMMDDSVKVSDGGLVFVPEFKVVLLFHDNTIMDISDKMSAGGEGTIIYDNTRRITRYYDLSDDQVSPRNVVGVYINDILVSLELDSESLGTESETRYYIRSGEAADTVTETSEAAPIPISPAERKEITTAINELVPTFYTED